MCQPTMIELKECRSLVGLNESVTLSFSEPSVIAIVGANGAGKSSLLRLFAGLNSQDLSTVSVFGQPLSEYTSRERAQKVAFLPQALHTSSDLSVKELVEQGLYPNQKMISDERARALVNHAIEELDLSHLVERRLSMLSGGEQRRAFIARTMSQNTPIILLDEPLSSLDWPNQERLMRLFDSVRKQRPALVILTMHNLNLAALYADQLILLRGGEVIGCGTPKELMTEETLERTYGEVPLLKQHPNQSTLQHLPWGAVES